MHTRCPTCQAVFRIARAQLDAAGGRVRCGECGGTFDARASLQRELPFDRHEDRQAPGDRQAHGEAGAFGTPPGFRETMPGLLLSEIEQEPTPAGRQRQATWRLLGWGLANAILLLLLGAQLLFVQRDAFAQDPRLRPVLTSMCAVVNCTLPSRRAVERIELVRRHVYAHPNVDDALLIDITLVNNAGFAQPYPVLSVSLGDLQGETLVRRHFPPRVYQPALGQDARMAPGSPVNVVLEVHDPGPDARTFDLDFH